MHRRRFLLALVSLVPAVALVVAVGATPPSAYALPTFEIDTGAEPIRLTPEDLGVRRTNSGLEIDETRFDTALTALAAAFHRDGVPHSYQLVDDGVVLTEGRPGVELDVQATKALLLRALRGAKSDLTVPVTQTPPPPAPDHAIVVTLEEFRLDLYRSTDLSESFTVGVGKLRFPTPPGVYHIKSKAKNPSWTNPGSAWAKGMPRYLPPGPRNPLGTRALRLDRGALVIHGTPQPSSVGQRSSHGCIRMHKADVEKLFEIVPVGTAVFIVP